MSLCILKLLMNCFLFSHDWFLIYEATCAHVTYIHVTPHQEERRLFVNELIPRANRVLIFPFHLQSLRQRRYFFLFVCWEKRQPVSQLNVISQRCVTVATWAGRGGALMQCAVSSAQPRVAARPPIRLRQQSPVYARTWRLTSSGGGLVDFLCTLPLLSGFISPPQRLHILRLCLQTRLSLLEDVGINLNRAPRVWLVPLFVFSLGLSQGKYAKRKSRFKRSDGSTSSDTTSNSFVRQVNVSHFNPPLPRTC